MRRTALLIGAALTASGWAVAPAVAAPSEPGVVSYAVMGKGSVGNIVGAPMTWESVYTEPFQGFWVDLPACNNWADIGLPEVYLDPDLASFNGAVTQTSATDRRHLVKQAIGVFATNDAATRAFLDAMNREHAAARPGHDELGARLSAYELAARMQLAAPEITDLSREPAHVHALYGTGDANPLKAAYARNCLLARRFLEQGVRFVSLYCASRASAVDGLLNWDAHKTLKADYERHAPIFDGPTAALLTDLKQRGLLRDVLVVWCTEFGRMPTHQEGTSGRDHNPDAFTTWLMGAGVKGGVSHGATDDFGRRAAVDVATVHDFHATILHLLGFDHERLTYYHNGANRRLTDVHGHVIRPVLA